MRNGQHNSAGCADAKQGLRLLLAFDCGAARIDAVEGTSPIFSNLSCRWIRNLASPGLRKMSRGCGPQSAKTRWPDDSMDDGPDESGGRKVLGTL